MNPIRLNARRRLAYLAVSMLNEYEYSKAMSIPEMHFWEGLTYILESRFETSKFEPAIQTFEQRDTVIRELLRYLDVVALEPRMIPRRKNK